VRPSTKENTMTIIPISLIVVARWILYRISCGRKIPLDPRTLRPSNSPDAYADYQFVANRLADAHASVDSAGTRIDGLGFRFGWDATAPFAFVDLDHCRDPQTGEIDPWALAIITQLKSYTEASPSGSGVHILCRTQQPPEGGCRKGHVEIYTKSRWATVTGEHVDVTPVDLEDRTHELLALHREVFGVAEAPAPLPPASSATTSPLTDAELLHLALTAANGRRFHELYKGPVPPGDRSRLDFELVAKLMFWFGHDFDRVDRLFRQSALMRPKWWRADYRIHTMRAAAARVTERYSPTLKKEKTHAAGD
jgi:primase-polymerase (primpol)-like protein